MVTQTIGDVLQVLRELKWTGLRQWGKVTERNWNEYTLRLVWDTPKGQAVDLGRISGTPQELGDILALIANGTTVAGLPE